MQSLMILGRQPSLGLAELESLYGTQRLTPVGTKAVIVDIDPCLLAFDRLGGSTKFCKVLTILETTSWSEIEKFLIQASPGQSQNMPAGKMRLGLSLVDFKIELKDIHKSGLKLKKAIVKTGRNVRLVPNKALELNSAQVLHNQLTGPTGWELVLIRDGSNRTVIAQTIKVQAIDAYARRDQTRPGRDAKVGMLPPKLAQLIINLAVGLLPEDKLESICEVPADQLLPLPRMDQTILDPFCGSGVILQEAALMGYNVIGSDIDARMIDYAKQNMAWLAQNFRLPAVCCRLEKADATSYKWPQDVPFVASETYLGRPFSAMPSPEMLARTMSDCNMIIRKFLQNIANQLSSGSRLCLAVPAWQIRPQEFRHLPLVDQIDDLGYNLVSFEHAGSGLMYYREHQIVARQLLVITRK